MHAVVHTTGSIPAVLLGLPTSSSEAATVMDGWPMMQSGRGGEAVGAILASSVIGGVLGAIALLALAPFGGLMARQFTSAEVTALSASSLLAIAALSGRSLVLGLVVASLGVLAATVGLDDQTAVQRFTFGRLELWDGLNIGAIVAGLFVIPEMLRAPAALCGQDKAGKFCREAGPVRMQDILAGCRLTVRHGWLAVRSAVLGIVVGFIPGLGASVVVWLAYGHASGVTRSQVPFGQGAVEGVIAPEAANNSKEGGAMLPTLLFAVPGTSSMAILLGAFALIGIEVGPGMAAHDPWIIPLAGWVILIANVLAFPICLVIAPLLTHMAGLHRGLIVPFALMAATVAALAVSASVETLIQIVLFGGLGIVLTQLNWPRAPFLLGFVIGPILEGALTRTIMTVGAGALQRPMVLAVLTLALGIFLLSLRRGRLQDPDVRPSSAEGVDPATNRTFILVLTVLFAATLGVGWFMPGQASIVPVLASICGLAATLSSLTTVRVHKALGLLAVPNMLGLFLAYIAAIAFVGAPLASAAFALVSYALIARHEPRWLFAATLGFGAFAWLLAGETLGNWRPLTVISDLYYHAGI
jgi:TctA family transporter